MILQKSQIKSISNRFQSRKKNANSRFVSYKLRKRIYKNRLHRIKLIIHHQNRRLHQKTSQIKRNLIVPKDRHTITTIHQAQATRTVLIIRKETVPVPRRFPIIRAVPATSTVPVKRADPATSTVPSIRTDRVTWSSTRKRKRRAAKASHRQTAVSITRVIILVTNRHHRQAHRRTSEATRMPNPKRMSQSQRK